MVLKALSILIISLLTFSTIDAREIAIFDTDVCFADNPMPQNFRLQDLAKNSFRCEKYENKRLQGLSQHGLRVLNLLFKIYKQEEVLTIYYFSVFDQMQMKESRISQALKLLKEKPIDFILFAGGLPFQKKTELKTKHQFITSSGQVGRGIKQDTFLWPQNGSNIKTMVGSYKELRSGEKILPTGQLNEKAIDVLLPHKGKKSALKYSSFAATVFAGQVLNLCSKFSQECFKKITKETVIDKKSVRVLKEKIGEDL